MASDSHDVSNPKESEIGESDSNESNAGNIPTAGPPRELRVDAAHALRRPEPGAEAKDLVAVVTQQQDHALASAEETLGQRIDANASPEVLARQAVDLAHLLQEQLADLDHRSERINSREADFDSRIRNARLWLDERENELENREEALNQREAQLAGQAPEPPTAFDQDQLHQRVQKLDDREQSLTKLQIELEVSQVQIEEKLGELDIQTALCRSNHEAHDESRQSWEERQRELDQREAEVFMGMERNTCEEVSLAERKEKTAATTEQLTLRQEELREWEQRLAERASEAEFQRAELDRHLQQQQQQQADCDQQQQQLRFREQEIKTALVRFQRLGITEQKLVELEQRAQEFDMREAYLANAESLLAQQQMQLIEGQRELEQQELAFENRVTSERRDLAKQRQDDDAARQRHEQQLNRREAEIEQRQTALQHLQEELRASQREVLEMRLATEETWLQLQGALAPATLSRSIAQVRAKLADHFQMSTADVQNRRQDLENVRQELAEQNAHFQQQRADLQQWLERRERDIEQRAARLVSREQELDAQQRHYEQEARKWQIEQSQYQQEIQKLLGQQRRTAQQAA